MSLPLRIPETHNQAIKELAELPIGTVSILAKKLACIAPSFSARDIALHASTQEKFKGVDVIKLIKLLLAMHSVREAAEVDIDSFIDVFCLSAQKILNNQNKVQVLKDSLKLLLVVNTPLNISAKAIDLFTEHERIFRDARILTDLRPVFPESVDVENSPSAIMATHMLKVEYNRDGQRKSLFVVLDGNDIRNLKDTLDRAIDKENKLKKIFNTLDVTYMDTDSLLENE